MPNNLMVGGFGSINGSTACTVLRLCACVGFSHYLLHVSQVQTTRVQFVDAKTTSLKGETSGRPNFFVFRLIEAPKEPRQGFLDTLKPLEQSVCQFEHCKICF